MHIYTCQGLASGVTSSGLRQLFKIRTSVLYNYIRWYKIWGERDDKGTDVSYFFNILGTSFLEMTLTGEVEKSFCLSETRRWSTFSLLTSSLPDTLEDDDNPHICTIKLPPTRSFERLPPDINNQGTRSK